MTTERVNGIRVRVVADPALVSQAGLLVVLFAVLGTALGYLVSVLWK